jgi:arylsulfatase A-like enzyme
MGAISLKGQGTAVVLFSFLAGACGAGGSSGGEAEAPPNVILISLDTLRYDHCGFNGYERDTTPFLDSFAKQCVAFDRAYTTMSWTLIAHMSMLTGLYPTQHGVMEAELALSPEFPTLTERLADEGYTNVGVHYPGWLDDRFGFGRGFGFYQSAPSAAEAERKLESGLEGVRPGWPYFMFIHLFDIHSGSLVGPSSTMYDPPPPFDEMFMEGARSELTGLDMQAWWDKPAAPTPKQLEAIVALYDGGIRYTDSMLEAWFTDWEERGLLDNTIVIITADHGEGLRQRLARFGGHGDLNEEGLRIPMLVRLPGGERGGERIDSLVSLVDIVPTVLELAGFEADDRLPGRSLLGPPRPADEWVYAARTNIRAAVRRDRKVIYRESGPALVYDLIADPEELQPLGPGKERARFLAEAPPLFEDLREQLEGYFSPPSARDVGELDEGTRNDLKALGYGGEVGGD